MCVYVHSTTYLTYLYSGTVPSQLERSISHSTLIPHFPTYFLVSLLLLFHHS